MKNKSTVNNAKDLTLLDRIVLPGILPKEGDFKTMTIVRDIVKKVDTNQEENNKYQIELAPSGDGKHFLKWNDSGKKAVFPTIFTKLEELQICLALKDLQDKKKVTNDTYHLFELFGIGNE